MKKIIIACLLIAATCSACAPSVSVHKGYVYDAAQDNCTDQWAIIGTDAGCSLLVDKQEAGIDCDDSVYVYVDGGIIKIQKVEEDFLDATKSVETETLIDLFH